MTLERQPVPFLDVDATPVTVSELTAVLSTFVAEGGTRTVVGHNLHSVTLFHSDPGFRSFYEHSDVVLIDGAPVLWLWAKTGEEDDGRGPVMDYRLGSTDWIPALGNVGGLERIAVIGAGAVANAGAVARLREIVPGARVDGMPGEGWNQDVEEAAVEWLSRLRPQLVLLGLGMPLQEQVLARRLAHAPAGRLLHRGRRHRTDCRCPETGAALDRPARARMGLAAHAPPAAGGLPGVRRAVGPAGPAAAPAAPPATLEAAPAPAGAAGQNFWSSSGPKPLPRSPVEKARNQSASPRKSPLRRK